MYFVRCQRFGDMRDASQVSELQERIRPFVLRRMKESVEKSIPSKEETIIDIELTMLQKQYYRAIYERNMKFLKQVCPRNACIWCLCRYIAIFNVVFSLQGCSAANTPRLVNIEMQLRKCCNHPYLIEGVEDKHSIGQITVEVCHNGVLYRACGNNRILTVSTVVLFLIFCLLMSFIYDCRINLRQLLIPVAKWYF